MSTEPSEQVLASSMDAVGISVATTHRAAADSTQVGSVYEAQFFAAGVPVWFHPLVDGAYQGVFRDYWTDATVSSTEPQRYSAKTAAGASGWFRFDPATGVRSAPEAVPSSLSTGLVVAGATRSAYLWLLRDDGVLQLFLGSSSGMLLQAEEQLSVDGASWLGVQSVGLDVRVYYSLSNQVHFMSKPGSSVGYAVTWLHMGENGPTDVAGDAAPLIGSTGSAVTSVGPVSAAVSRGRTWLTTVELSSSTYYGKVWSSRGAHDPWAKGSLSAGLGTSATWCGQGVQLQPQLLPYAPAVATAGVETAVPWVKSLSQSGSGLYWIDTTWSLLSVDQG